MKKIGIFIGIVLSLLFATKVSASLYNYYNSLGLELPSVQERSVLAEDCGIVNYTGTKEQNIKLKNCISSEKLFGATPTPSSSAVIKYVETPDFYAYSPAVSGDTSITINNFIDIYGNTLIMSDIGDLGYGRIDPDGAEISESFTFSGVTANSDGTFTLTGVKSALAKYPYTQTSGLTRSHSINAIVRITNTAAFYDNFSNKENDEIIDGTWIYNATPVSSSTEQTYIGDEYFATQKYVNDVGAGGFTESNVAENQGLQTFGTAPETVGVYVRADKGMVTSTTGIYQSVDPSTGVLGESADGITFSTSTLTDLIATSTPTANKVVRADGSNKIADGWLGMTTQGDMLYSDGTDLQRLAKGTAGQVITMNSGATVPEWGKTTRIYTDYTGTTVANVGDEHTIFSATIPAGLLGTENILRFKLLFDSIDGDSANWILKIKMNGTQILAKTINPTGTYDFAELRGEIMNSNSSSSQKAFFIFTINGYSSLLTDQGTSTIDTSSDVTFTITSNMADAIGTSVVTSYGYLEVVK